MTAPKYVYLTSAKYVAYKQSTIDTLAEEAVRLLGEHRPLNDGAQRTIDMSDDEQLQQFGRLVTDDEWEELYRLRSRQNAYFHESRAKLEAKLNELGRTHPPALQDWMREHDYKFEPDSLAVDGPQWRIYERRRCVQSALRGWALLAVLVALTLAALWIVVSIVF